MGDEFTFEDALIVLRRRLWLMVLPAVAIAVIGLVTVMLLPAMYTAQGTILVESAQIPSELVRSTISTYAQERIQTIRQRVMTRERLLAVSDKYKVFPKEQGFTDSERVRLMRDRLKLNLITAEGARTSGQRDGTIAFTVSYTDRSPNVAYQVANEFMTLFLSEDVRTRTAGAANTTDFFKQEVARLAASVDTLEAAIAKYKSENASALPEHLNLHLDALERANRDHSTASASLTTLEEEIRFLETQLMSHLAGANSETGPARELNELKARLVQLRTVYQDAHPDVAAVRAQIAALERELAPSKEVQELQRSLATAEIALKTAQREMPEGDPAIAARQSEVQALQARLSERIARQATATGGDFLSAQLQGRIAVANNRRMILEEQRDRAQASIADLEARIARTPEVERGLAALTRDHQNLFREYQEILAKQQEAQLAENLEDNQKAEKFSILEAAMRPEESTSPQRSKLAVLVLFVAAAVGAGLALGAELLFATVRGNNHLTRLIDAHPIAVIPYIGGEDRPKSSARSSRRRAAQASAAAAAAAAVLVAGPLALEDEAAPPLGGAADKDA